MKTMMRFAAVVAVLSLLAVPAGANVVAKVKVTDGPGSGNGGAFSVAVLIGSLPVDPFKTFCVELDEHLTLQGEYWAEVATSAQLGGAGGPSPDPLDPITAALYKQWLALNSTDDVIANKYQLAIWRTEQEAYWDGTQWKQTGGGALQAAYQSISEGDVNTLVTSVGTPSGIGDVRVLRLWVNQNGTGIAQDLLVYGVPAPGAALLVIIGMPIIGWVKRRVA